MWAILAKDDETVETCYPPDTPLNVLEEETKGKIVIKMTAENSPAWLNGKWDGKKFYPPVQKKEKNE